ncbi:MAG: hypothetical protein GKR90_24415 [Pseudomonadales bacterium]|nr:hypothetical protein [Pseudomonadales bacterium]
MTLLHSLLRILFQRGSPERILYARKLFIASLFGAIAASALLQHFVYLDHLVFVILRIFAELTMFMLWIVFLTAKVARLRLANMMLVLLLISILVDLTTLVLGLVTPVEWRIWLGIGVGAIASYGVGNVVGWALRNPIQIGMLHFYGYIAVVTALDLSFRGLYNTMVGA